MLWKRRFRCSVECRLGTCGPGPSHVGTPRSLCGTYRDNPTFSISLAFLSPSSPIMARTGAFKVIHQSWMRNSIASGSYGVVAKETIRRCVVPTSFHIFRPYLAIGWAYKTVADRDALVVDILRRNGAVLFVKTQNPQTLLVRNARSSRSSQNLIKISVIGNEQ